MSNLTSHHGRLSCAVCGALCVCLCLQKELQREAFRGVDEMEMSYVKTRDDIIAMVDRKLGAEKPVPMEIGNVGAGRGKKESEGDLE